ncbi:hypothetical protein ACLB2K_028774 [Fragaria x ananassa]
MVAGGGSSDEKTTTVAETFGLGCSFTVALERLPPVQNVVGSTADRLGPVQRFEAAGRQRTGGWKFQVVFGSGNGMDIRNCLPGREEAWQKKSARELASLLHYGSLCVVVLLGKYISMVYHGGTSQNPIEAIRWLPAPDRTLKINFDGSSSNTSAASGVIFRDSEGNPVFASSRNMGITSVPIAEAAALRDNLINAKTKGYTDIQVEWDSKMVINAVNEKISPPWRIQQIVQDIKKIAQDFSTISFKHIYREANFAADAIANTGH